MVSCATKSDPADSNGSETGLAQGDKAHLISGIEIDENGSFFDDFSSGINKDNWIIGSGAWGNGNGGVVPGNVFYTDEGTLLLRGNGSYYSKNEIKGLGTLKDGRNTGAALISRFGTRPGHYEVKMKPLPRLGACSAFWTYANRNGTAGEENDNHEIDIELPGGKNSGLISFKNILNTNYVTESLSISQDTELEKVTEGKTINLNDGNFHVFGFDWYTDPALIVYTVDGYVSAVSDSFIPTLEGRLWLGDWFPNNSGFVGNSLFETDYMEVDWVKYLPFKNQPFTEYNAAITVNEAEASQYPSSPIVRPSVNKIANGDFEYYLRKGTEEGYGFEFSRLSSSEEEIKDVCYVSPDAGFQGSAGAVIRNGGYLSSVIDSVYGGQKFKFGVDAKSEGGSSKIILRYRDSSESNISSETLEVTSTDWAHHEKEITAPDGTYSLLIQIYSQKESDNLTIDNLSLTKE